ncbi:uncharacterized protein LY89DRAFT_627975 [Mollisia scopiformis]|uniref:Uncharacterized protein n=1 Tax=Mollisia scopiformis TaxID=149040 RepID=A0A132BD02_MOLSC|nr:uncharacterized protein LY89DRAFT_627975 [Mollisia scopiformis]KUJ09724.1 hypothetical protein LY89DRAFT_627975 [Mollisia scopiformis]
MTSIRDRLQSAAAENSRLSQTRSETAYSVSAYQQSQNYVGNLKKQISIEENKLADVNEQVAREYEDHQKYRDSHMRRLAYNLGGKKEKFAEQATKEEKEWLDAVALQLRTKKGLEGLNRTLADATKASADLLAIVKVHNRAGVERDALYNSIFEGPTPEMPEEDAKEREVREAENNFNVDQLLSSTETQARAILGDADKFLKRAMGDIQDAGSSATADVWGVGGTFAEMAENNALSRCQQNVSQVEMLVTQAQRVQPAVGHLGDMRVAQMDFMSNVVFDNIFSDMAMRDRIHESMGQLSHAQSNLNREMQAADQRISRAQSEVTRAKSVLDRQRSELQQVRAAAFERLANGMEVGVGRPPEYAAEPPAYSA